MVNDDDVDKDDGDNINDGQREFIQYVAGVRIQRRILKPITKKKHESCTSDK